MKKYDYVLVQTTDKKRINLYINLEFLKRNNSIFVFHEITFAQKIYKKYFNGNRIPKIPTNASKMIFESLNRITSIEKAEPKAGDEHNG